MYHEFTDRARNAMSLAADEARRMNHEYVGTEHVLAALVDQNSGPAETSQWRLKNSCNVVRCPFLTASYRSRRVSGKS
jgi:ATP-dependent Clp protease ATP-binding subunit ClpC